MRKFFQVVGYNLWTEEGDEWNDGSNCLYETGFYIFDWDGGCIPDYFEAQNTGWMPDLDPTWTEGFYWYGFEPGTSESFTFYFADGTSVEVNDVLNTCDLNDTVAWSNDLEVQKLRDKSGENYNFDLSDASFSSEILNNKATAFNFMNGGSNPYSSNEARNGCPGEGPDVGCDGVCFSGLEEDCAGECGGSATEDCAGECGGSATEDCAGECGGSAVEDECGECGGDNSTCIDECGILNGGNFCAGDNSQFVGEWGVNLGYAYGNAECTFMIMVMIATVVLSLSMQMEHLAIHFVIYQEAGHQMVILFILI